MTDPIDGAEGSDGISPSVTGEGLAESLRAIETAEPLVQELTNTVTMNDVANLTRHWGALPVMADTPGDAGEMAELADALLLNPGQVPERKVEAMHEAGHTANDRGVPIVLDPVGVGATRTRRDVAEDLLSELEFAAIKGNYGEISALAGVEAEVRGVESIGEYDEIAETARTLAASTDAIVVASGETDVVANANGAYALTAGHERMGRVVGTGCLLGATLATFCGAVDDPLTACIHGTLAYGIAGERAANLDSAGPASYRIDFLDSIAGFAPTVAAGLEGLADRIEPVA